MLTGIADLPVVGLAEVYDFGDEEATHQDVGWLQVQMHDLIVD
jgi:hypothetical protein